MSNTPNKSEQVAETDLNKSENDCRQDVCYGGTLSRVDDEKVVSEIGVYNGVQQSPGPKEMCTLDTTPAFLPPSSSSTTNVILLPLSSIPVTDGITSGENGESAAVSSSSMPDAWLLPPASPGSKLREERKDIISLASLSILQIPEKHSFNATLEGLQCSPDSGTLHVLPMATCNSGLRSCLATPPSAEVDLTVHGGTSKSAELPVTPLTTCVGLITPTQQTVATFASPVSHSAYMSTLSMAADQCSPCDPMPDSHPGPIVDEREASEPVLLRLGLDALTPMPLSDTLAGNLNSSPSLRGQHSDLSTSQTTPPSSPRTEYDTAKANDEAGARTANVASETYGFPTRIMSSPGPSFGWGDMLSSSPPQQNTTGTKRPACDSSDEDWTSGKPVKRMQMGGAMSSPPSAPAPRRATLASQKLSRKKLAAPFRSPLAVKLTTVKVVTPVSRGEVPREQVVKEPQTKCKAESNPVCLTAQKTLVRSSRAAAQFRSPLVKTVEHGTRPLVLPSQATMTLERKLTFLRRAVKIKRDRDESHLERLAVKWRDAAREAAYELWSIVRDLSTEGGEVRSNSSDAGWGWEERNGHGTVGNDAEDEEHGAQKENTLGVMLRKLGIAPETLGWNDEEETFVDDDDVCE
ncbi:hypothetical protein EDB92DRAFT_954288 [Lactarius akahatsu]|uniref:Uncharacterized protein n=1 Tax=Lactarius akahatsu TaxID=416441 RepID=A0AAD4LR10_9AGAM|nr:hypothetical protein EDB92DRAFT_954288 [Lactarius akahatsu]